jgi:transcriptional regulator GlxA family with amidase domain
MTGGRREVAVVLFPGFELLDACGPIEVLAHLPEHFSVTLLGPRAGPIPSAQGVEVVAGRPYDQASPCDLVLVPGGVGTRTLVDDEAFCSWLARFAARAPLVASVCTGSAVLAAAGLLDGHRATSNKRAFSWASGQGSDVEWVKKARWVEDGDRWSSSGVAAGIDMALALVARLHSEALAHRVADALEIDWHEDPRFDPFAERHGLTAT